MLLMEKITTALKNARAQIRILGHESDEVNKAHLAELDEVIAILESPNPDKYGFFYWFIKVGIQKTWVEDGADFTDRRAQDLVSSHLSWARDSELKATVISRPDDAAVAKVMGYKTVEEYLERRKD